EARVAIANGTAPNLLWGRDYPHPEGTWPYTKYSIRKAMSGIDEGHVRAFLGQTAAAAFGLDRVALQAVADEIGPVIDEVMTPLGPNEEPPGGKFTAAFRNDGQRGPF